MIKVCDSIMGSGKTSAAIEYMNERPDRKFIFITPYLSEAERIRDSCPDLDFVEPKSTLEEFSFSKVNHTAALIAEGRNITSTHQAFKYYTAEMLGNIASYGYTLIIDECVDVLEAYEITPGDLDMLVECGYVTRLGEVYTRGQVPYKGTAFRKFFRILESRELVCGSDPHGKVYYYWMLPPSFLRPFQEVIVLTYMFRGQSLYHMLRMNDIPFKYIGVVHSPGGDYRFGPAGQKPPQYVHQLGEMIHILDNERMNEVGDARFALSMSWFARGGAGVDRLAANIGNFFRNIQEESASENRLCGSFANCKGKIKGKGYTKAIVPFNLRATNEYRTRNCLVYAVNVFMNANEKRYYSEHGSPVDEDAYALSTMVQWIWRSAIREGNEVDIYIPSRRMRDLLRDWIETVSKGVTAGAA